MSGPVILAFDTAAAHCAAVLLSGTQELSLRIDPMAKGQAEHLLPMLTEMLADQGLGWHDLAAIGVGIGPGNFTGIRISVAAARGLALGLGIPAIGVSAFAAAADNAARPVTVHLPAPQDMAYVQTLYDKGESAPALVPRPAAMVTIPAAQSIRAIARITAAHWQKPDQPRPAPLYVRPADAAPPRDPAPVMLT